MFVLPLAGHSATPGYGAIMGNTNGHVHTTPIFPVASMSAASSFYQDLGFEVEAFDDSYAWVRYGGQEIPHLRRVEGLDPLQNESGAHVHTRDADRWHQAWSSAGCTVGDFADHPWGMREFSMADPSGNVLRVGHNL